MNEDLEYRISRLEALLDLLSRQEAGREVLGLMQYSKDGTLVLPPQQYGGSEGGELQVQDADRTNVWSLDNFNTTLRVHRSGLVPLTIDPTALTVTIGSGYDLRFATAWTGAAFAANWSDFGAGQATVGYRKIGGLVYLKGLAKKAVALVASDLILTLPAGYRPVNEHIFYTSSATGATQIRVNSSGGVYISAGGSNTWTSLAGICFDPAT